MNFTRAVSATLRTVAERHASHAPQYRLMHMSSPLKKTGIQSSQSGHHPDIWDKRMLVWMKKYPNMDAVPSVVPSSTMDKARNQVRIRANLFLCIMTGVVSYFVYQYGKKQTISSGENFYNTHQSVKNDTTTTATTQ